MSDQSRISAQIVQMAQDVFGLEDEQRIAGYADEVAEMMQTLSSASLEKTLEPFTPTFEETK